LYNGNKLVLFVFIPIILVFILFLSTATHHHQQQQNALAQINDSVFKTYENSTYGIRMQYPSDWKKVEPSQVSQASNFNIIVGFISPKESVSDTSPPAALSIGIHNLSSSQDITPDQYTDTHINSIRKQTNLLESNATALKGNSSNNLAHKVVYINSEGQKIMQVWTVKGDKAYHITYAANETRYTDYLPPIQKMINSFEIVDLTEFNNNSAPSVISNSTGLFPLA
jgi:hypothetical protein